MNGKKLRVAFNSPVILGFTGLCLIALILDYVTKGYVNTHFFSVYRSSLVNPLTYVRLFGHVAGHAGMDHFLGNSMLILVVGPLLEEKYGSYNILFIILTTALESCICYVSPAVLFWGPAEWYLRLSCYLPLPVYGMGRYL